VVSGLSNLFPLAVAFLLFFFSRACCFSLVRVLRRIFFREWPCSVDSFFLRFNKTIEFRRLIQSPFLSSFSLFFLGRMFVSALRQTFPFPRRDRILPPTLFSPPIWILNLGSLSLFCAVSSVCSAVTPQSSCSPPVCRINPYER